MDHMGAAAAGIAIGSYGIMKKVNMSGV